MIVLPMEEEGMDIVVEEVVPLFDEVVKTLSLREEGEEVHVLWVEEQRPHTAQE